MGVLAPLNPSPKASSNSPVPGAAAPRLLCYLLPSVADMLFIALLISLAYGTPRLLLLNDPGIGWHIRTGEWILQHHAVPHTDLFSNVASRSWFAWEWLFEAVLAKIHAWSGLNGVLASGSFLFALTFALLFRWTLRRGAPFLPALVFVVLAVFASTIHALARPHLLTWLFTLLCWYLLEKNTRRVGLIPLLMLIWVNVHGGFLVAFVLMGLILAGDVWQILVAPTSPGSSDRNSLRLCGVLAVSFLASLCNPYGIRLYSHIYQYLGDSFLMHHILEMQSPNFHSFAAKAFAALLLLAVSVAVANRDMLRPSQVFVLTFFSAAALVAVRNIPLAVILLTLTVAPLLNNAQMGNRLRNFSDRMGAMESNARGHLWAIVFTLATIAACANGGSLFGHRMIHAGFNPERFPLRAVDFLAQHPIDGPLFTTDAWSGYIIYRQWPGLTVVVDDRHDMYGSEYMRNYLEIVNGEKDWQEHLTGTGAQDVLVSENSALASLLRLSPGWELLYEDDQAALFANRKK